MQGRLSAKSPEANYSMVTSEKNGEIVAVAYTESILQMEQAYTKISFVNGTGWDKLYIENRCEEAEYQCNIYTCTGQLTQSNDIILKMGMNTFEVPVSGMMLIVGDSH